MPPMPVYYVGKGTQFGVLDQFDGSDQQAYETARERLSGSASLAELAEQRGGRAASRRPTSRTSRSTGSAAGGRTSTSTSCCGPGS